MREKPTRRLSRGVIVDAVWALHVLIIVAFVFFGSLSGSPDAFPLFYASENASLLLNLGGYCAIWLLAVVASIFARRRFWSMDEATIRREKARSVAKKTAIALGGIALISLFAVPLNFSVNSFLYNNELPFGTAERPFQLYFLTSVVLAAPVALLAWLLSIAIAVVGRSREELVVQAENSG